MNYPKIRGFVPKPLPKDVAEDWGFVRELAPYMDETCFYLRDCDWVASPKYDGCNVRAEWNGATIRVAGRTEGSRLQKEVQELLERTFMGREDDFRYLFGSTPATLFMECYGGKVQGSAKRGLYLDRDGNPLPETLVGFDVAVDGRFLPRTRNSLSPVFNRFSVPCVPFIGSGEDPDDQEYDLLTLDDIIYYVDECAERGCADEDGNYFEGFVIHPRVPLLNADGNRVIFKVKCSHFGASPSEAWKGE